MSAWWNDYVGIPYVNAGRDRAGVDCWGLVRLVYAERYQIDLPSGEGDYDAADGAQVAAIFGGPEREAWGPVDMPASGDVVLLRILGYPSHLGIITEPGKMLHSRDGADAVIVPLDSGAWRHRIDGYYRHQARSGGIVLSGCPHPLKTVNIAGTAPEGASLLEMISVECLRANVPEALRQAQGHAWIEGEYIPAGEWGSRYPKAGQRVEYRVLPTGGRTFAMLAVMIAVVVFQQYYLAPMLAGAVAAGTMTATSAMMISAGVGMALNFAGNLLINAIAPIRPPTQAQMDTSQGKAKFQLQGGANNMTPYAAVPVTLGQFRWTPPVAAKTFATVSSTDSFLTMALCWGYGPLDVSDLRIGDTPLTSFDDIEIAHLRGVAGEDKSAFTALYGNDTSQEYVGITLELGVPIIRTTDPEVDSITVTINYPMGLGYLSTADGNLHPLGSVIAVRVRQVGTGAWEEVAQTIYQKDLLLPTVYDEETLTKTGGTDIGDWWLSTYGTSKSRLGDAGRLPLYQWSRITLDKSNKLILRHGALTDNKYAAPSATLLAVMEAHNYGLQVTYDRLPQVGAAEEPLWLICVNGETITDIIDERDASVTGCALSVHAEWGLWVQVAAGSITRAQAETINHFNATKDGFDENITFYVPRGQYEVYVQTYTDHSVHIANNPNDQMLLTEVFTTLTGRSAQRPIVFPKPLAMTAIRIRANNQINGSLDGITGTVKAVCPDWVRASGTWVTRNTRNPASLYRYVLQHPANAIPVADAAIDLTTLQRWHSYCVANGFAFDMVVTGQRPLLDVLRDIAAAGRASPQLVDGKWTVVIDEPKPTIVQHFTPHNSWGFEGTRILPKRPHALRIKFYSRAKGYQQDERVVYDDGYSVSNATLIEAIELPGITDEVNVHAFGRFHLAQLTLRPDEYGLNADLEHLICTRGDKVRVTHHVPMWGLGSGRIREVLVSGANATGIVVDESLPMDAGVSYGVRIRRRNGVSQTCTITPAGTDGLYSTLMFVTPITSSLIAANDLVLYGVLNAESVELLVKGIEPDNKGGARLSLVDYAPGVFNADEETIPAFASQITLPPRLLQAVIAASKTPIIQAIATDESAMTRSGVNSLQAGIKIAYRNPAGLPVEVTHIEAQFALDGSAPKWAARPPVPITAGSIWLTPVKEGNSYTFRLRYVNAQGLTGKWVTQTGVLVTGRSNPPGDVAWFNLDGYRLSWDAVSDIDLAGYQIRLAAGVVDDWAACEPVHTGNLRHSPYWLDTGLNGVVSIHIKAIDTAGNLSRAPATIVADFGALHLANLLADHADQHALGWPNTTASPGSLIDGATGDLISDVVPSPPMWSSYGGFGGMGPYTQMWQVQSTTLTWRPTFYYPIYYECSFLPAPAPAGTKIRVALTVSGDSQLYYRKSPLVRAWGDSAAPVYTEDGALQWHVSDWKYWPGALTSAGEIIEFHLGVWDVSGGQPRVSVFDLQLDAPDIVERFNDLAISAGGTRPGLTQPFSVIREVFVTLQDDGGSAYQVKVMDKSLTGPLIQCFDVAALPTSGLVDITVHGF